MIGSASFANKLASEIEDTGIRGYKVVGYIGEELGRPARARRPGSARSTTSAPPFGSESIDLLVVAPRQPAGCEVFEQPARDCLDLPVRMIEATALYEDVLGHVPIGHDQLGLVPVHHAPALLALLPALQARARPARVGPDAGRCALPLMLLCALAIKLEDRGPVFYRQRRVGEEGREFDMRQVPHDARRRRRPAGARCPRRS